MASFRDPKFLVFLGGTTLGVAILTVGVIVAVNMLRTPEPPPVPKSPTVTEVTPHTPESHDGPRMEGPYPDDDLPVTEYEIEDMTPGMDKKAEELARVWVGIDTSLSREERRAQLAEVIPNPDDWVDKEPAVTYHPAGRGVPGMVTKVTVTSAEIALPSMRVNGVNEMLVNVSYQALHWRGSGVYLGSETTSFPWIFHLLPDGTLVDIVEPDIQFPDYYYRQ